MLDVAIVGGGPAGLTCAAAVVAALGQECSVKVFESYEQYKPQGAGVGVMENGQSALEAISPELLAQFRSHGVVGYGGFYDLKGEKTLSFSSFEKVAAAKAASNGKEKTPFILGWHEVRHLLHHSLPIGTVEFGAQVSHYKECEDGVVLHFKPGRPSVCAKVLIGADGYFSKVRQCCLNDGPPQFADRVIWRARFGWMEGLPEPSEENFRWYREPGKDPGYNMSAMLMQIGTVEETKDQCWYWILGCPIDIVREAGVDFDPSSKGIKPVQQQDSTQSALQNALKVFKDFPEYIVNILKNTDPALVTQHGLYMRPDGGRPNALTSSPQPPPTPNSQIPGPLEHQFQQQMDCRPSEHSNGNFSQDRAPHSQSTSYASQPSSNDAEPCPTPFAPQPDPTFTPITPQASYKGSDTCQQQDSETNANPHVTQIAPQAHSPLASPAAEGSCQTPASCGPLEAEGSGGWGRGRVTLIGDAAHPTIANGQGVNLAFEDGLVLAWHLNHKGINQQALRSYERERLPRVQEMHARHTSSGDVAQGTEAHARMYKPKFKPLWGHKECANTDTCIITKENK